MFIYYNLLYDNILKCKKKLRYGHFFRFEFHATIKFMLNCIFCKIVKGELKVKKVHETDSVLAFVPKDQVSKGHTLVIPKEHHEDIFNISEEALKDVIIVSQKLSKKNQEELGATGINLLHASGIDAQQSVPHFHIHIVPRYPDDNLDLWIKTGIEVKLINN
jgi:histidine triad (HIT) family protein